MGRTAAFVAEFAVKDLTSDDEDIKYYLVPLSFKNLASGIVINKYKKVTRK